MPQDQRISSSFGWQAALGDRLRAQRRGPAWGYGAEHAASAAAEPTALAVLALASSLDRRPQTGQAVKDGLAWLTAQQRSDGRVGVTEKIDQPGWTTALAVLAWECCTAQDGAKYAANVAAGVDWLLQVRGEPIDPKAAGFAYDTTLVGWPWVRGTNSWLEPTAYAVMALKQAQHRPAPPANLPARLSEGVRVILDRAISGGGWNYGNPRALGNGLRAFLDTTGIALTALAGEPRCDVIDKALAFVQAELPHVKAPLSLGWGVLGLRAWDAASLECDAWIAESFAELAEEERTPVNLAMLLLAAAPRCPLMENKPVEAAK